MVLANTNEAAIFTPASEVEESVDIYLTKVFSRLPEAQVKEAARLYDNASNTAGMHPVITQIKSECASILLVSPLFPLEEMSVFFLCPTYWILDAFREKTARKVPVTCRSRDFAMLNTLRRVLLPSLLASTASTSTTSSKSELPYGSVKMARH